MTGTGSRIKASCLCSLALILATQLAFGQSSGSFSISSDHTRVQWTFSKPIQSDKSFDYKLQYPTGYMVGKVKVKAGSKFVTLVIPPGILSIRLSGNGQSALWPPPKPKVAAGKGQRKLRR